jgi:predicted small integral membrane protein
MSSLGAAALVAAVSYLAKDWLAVLAIAWVFLLMGGVVLFQNHLFRAIAFGALLGLSITLGYLIWFQAPAS